MNNISINCHSSIKIRSNQVIYFDPFKIETNLNDADIIFLTHDHYDHMSTLDIKKVIKDDTVLVAPESCVSKLKDINNRIISVLPNCFYDIKGIKVETVLAYNSNKPFHFKENNWVGYIVTIDNLKYYIAGDTDITEENKKVKCDIALIPVGGTYTMDYKEAAELVNLIKPALAVPTHYGSITGSRDDGINFSKLLDPNIKCKILIK